MNNELRIIPAEQVANIINHTSPDFSLVESDDTQATVLATFQCPDTQEDFTAVMDYTVDAHGWMLQEVSEYSGDRVEAVTFENYTALIGWLIMEMPA